MYLIDILHKIMNVFGYLTVWNFWIVWNRWTLNFEWGWAWTQMDIHWTFSRLQKKENWYNINAKTNLSKLNAIVIFLTFTYQIMHKGCFYADILVILNDFRPMLSYISLQSRNENFTKEINSFIIHDFFIIRCDV